MKHIWDQGIYELYPTWIVIWSVKHKRLRQKQSIVRMNYKDFDGGGW